MAKAKKKKYSASDKAILGIGYVLLGAFVLSILVPLLYVVIASFMDPNVLNSQGISFDVRKWTIDAYRRVLENNMIWRGFANSFFYSLVFYHYFSSGNSAGSISNVQERICGKKFLQCYFSHYHVFRWRNDPDFYPDQSAASGKYNLGNPASGCV